MEAATGTWYAPLFALALATGARRGELLALKWEDVDFSPRHALDSARTRIDPALWRPREVDQERQVACD